MEREGESEGEREREKSEGGKHWKSEVEMTLRDQGDLHQFIAIGTVRRPRRWEN